LVGGALEVAAQAAPGRVEQPELPPGIDVGASVPSEGRKPAAAPPLGLAVQGWLQQTFGRDVEGASGTAQDSRTARAALDYRKEWSLSREWRAGLSDRFDVVRALDGGSPSELNREVNSLREAWASRRFGEGESSYFVDAGRINVRNGVASGYNPTDFFKTNAVRFATSFDPSDLRFDRLGTVMVRAQAVTPSGAWTVAVAPRLSSRDSFDDSTFALGLERTNRQHELYAKWAPQFSQRVSVDGLIFARNTEQPQLGLNGSWLASDAVIVNAEWAGGRVVPLVGPSEPTPARDWRNRTAVNVTWTTPLGLELTAEYQYAADALSSEAWREWRNADNAAAQPALARMASTRANAREPLVRSNWFMRAAWQDAFGVRGVDGSAFVQINGYDSSATWQLKVTWRLDQQWSLTGQMGGNRGNPGTEFGSIPVRSYAAVYLTDSF
jgi:hypothetical protein